MPKLEHHKIVYAVSIMGMAVSLGLMIWSIALLPPAETRLDNLDGKTSSSAKGCQRSRARG